MTPYAIDPDLAPWVELLPDLSWNDPAAVRATLRGLSARVPRHRPPGTHVRDVSIEDGGVSPVPARIYRPPEPTGSALLYLHGGGFVSGDLDTEDLNAVELAIEVNCVVVAVDYRLAPEHPYPAGLEDCYRSLCWITEQADVLGIDPERIGVSGISAGGGLAAGLALLARDRGGPHLCFQRLHTPALDDRCTSTSARTFVDTPVLDRDGLLACWSAYLGQRLGEECVPVYAAPGRADDLSGLPPTYVSVAEFDPLRDDALHYAHRLIKAGVPTELHHAPGTFHTSQGIRDAAVSRRSNDATVAALRRGLAPRHAR